MGWRYYAIKSLKELHGYLTGGLCLEKKERYIPKEEEQQFQPDFADVMGQQFAKKALEGRGVRRAQSHNDRLARLWKEHAREKTALYPAKNDILRSLLRPPIYIR